MINLEFGPQEEFEREANQEELAELQRQLGARGLYNANDGTLGSEEHPEDEQWIERGRE